MAEPLPPNVTEGPDAPDVLPASKEDRKAAAALSSLDAKPTDENAQPKKEVDLKALGEAMKTLEIAGGGATKPAVKKENSSVTEAPKKLIKVDAADVNLLVDQLDLSKTQATDLLRAHDADATKAIRAWVSPAAA